MGLESNPIEELFLEGMIMANNKAQTRVDDTSLARRREVLRKRREMLGSYAALARELDVNVRYVYEFIVRGQVPANKQVRDKMGIVWASKGARRYRALSKVAQAAGWRSWSCRAVLNGDAQIENAV